MTLLEIAQKLEFFDKEDAIYVSEPWTIDSQALVAHEPDSGGLPEEAQELGFKYFLEVSVAHDFLTGWIESLGTEPTLRERCARLIEYAVNDA